MFLGHFALAFAAKKAAPRTSLGTLFVAAQFADLLWPTLLLLGIERVRIDAQAPFMPLLFEHYPYSHSLLALSVWAVLLGGAYGAATRDRRGALVIAALVLSHWLLDVLVHRPDLPLVPGGDARFGLFLWSSPVVAIAVELALFAIGLTLYLRSRPGPVGRGAGLWALVALLLLIYGADRSGAAPPPSVAVLAWVGQATWLLVVAAYWVDRRGNSGAQAARPVSI